MGSLGRAAITNLKQFRSDLRKADYARQKAGQTATKVEGYRLMRELKAELRSGAPGGRAFSPLTFIGRERMAAYVRGDKGLSAGVARKRTPLKRLSLAVRYQVSGGRKRDPDKFSMAIGFVGPKVSKSWKRIARLQQAGFTETVDAELRRTLIARGAELRKKRKKAARYFFLKKSTRSFRIPARPIIDPFWTAHEAEASRNIEDNFRRKMRGERI